jgi:hypothetical protein
MLSTGENEFADDNELIGLDDWRALNPFVQEST